MRYLIVSLLLISSLFGQAIPISSGPPPAVSTTSAVVVGSLTQSETYCYWIVDIFPIGKVFPQNQGCVTNGPFNLNAQHSINVSWSTVAGATGYDVLKVKGSMSPPTTNCNCALVLNTQSNNISDTGQGLSNYSISTVGTANGALSINNRDFTAPLFQFSPYLLDVPGIQFPDGTQLLTATGATLQKTGNTNIFASAVTPVVAGQCAAWDVNGNVISQACGTGVGTVTHTGALTNNLPVVGNGGGDTIIGARTGNTTTFVSSAGVLVSGNSAKWDVNGNLIDSGGIPGTVTHTVGPLVAGQLLFGNGLGDINIGDLTGAVSTSGTNNTTLNPGIVAITNIAAGVLTGNGLQICSVTGALTNTASIKFDVNGNCIASGVTIDGSNNISTPGSMSTGVGGAGASYLQLKAGVQTWPGVASTAGWIGPSSIAGGSTYALSFPTALPVANQILVFPAPSSSVAQPTWLTLQLTGDVTSSAGSLLTSVVGVNNVSYPATPSVNSVPVITASNIATYEVVADCQDSGGNHINFTQSTHQWSCGNTSSGGAGNSLPSPGNTSPFTSVTRFAGWKASSAASFTGYGSTDSVIPTGNTFAGATNTVPFGITVFTTGTGANAIAGLSGDLVWRRNGNGLYGSFPFNIANVTNVDRWTLGFCSGTSGTCTASNAPANLDYFMLVWEQGTNAGDFMCVSNNNSATGVTTNTTTAADTSWHVAEVFFDTSDTHGKVKIDGVQICDVTSQLPTAATFIRVVGEINNKATGAAQVWSLGPGIIKATSN